MKLTILFVIDLIIILLFIMGLKNRPPVGIMLLNYGIFCFSCWMTLKEILRKFK